MPSGPEPSVTERFYSSHQNSGALPGTVPHRKAHCQCQCPTAHLVTDRLVALRVDATPQRPSVKLHNHLCHDGRVRVILGHTKPTCDNPSVEKKRPLARYSSRLRLFCAGGTAGF